MHTPDGHFQEPKHEPDVAPSAWFVEFDSREPTGPHQVGPFPSRQAADDWSNAQRFESASYQIVPLYRPVPSDLDVVTDASDEVPELYSAPEDLLLTAGLSTIVVKGWKLQFDATDPDTLDELAQTPGQLMVVLTFEGKINNRDEHRSYSVALPTGQLPHFMGMLLHSSAAAGLDPELFLEALTANLMGRDS